MDVVDAHVLDTYTGVRQRKTIINPCEFILNPNGRMMASMHATTRLGRMQPEEMSLYGRDCRHRRPNAAKSKRHTHS